MMLAAVCLAAGAADCDTTGSFLGDMLAVWTDWAAGHLTGEAVTLGNGL